MCSSTALQKFPLTEQDSRTKGNWERDMAKGNGTGSVAELGILLLLFRVPFGSRYPWQRVHCSLAIQCANLILFTLGSHVHIRVHVPCPCPRPYPCPRPLARAAGAGLESVSAAAAPFIWFCCSFWSRIVVPLWLSRVLPPPTPYPVPSSLSLSCHPLLSLFTSLFSYAFFCLAAASGASTQNTRTHTHTFSFMLHSTKSCHSKTENKRGGRGMQKGRAGSCKFVVNIKIFHTFMQIYF